jgi:hypothetical protein
VKLKATPNAYVVYAEAKCTDPDGKVIGYAWQVNGQPIGATSYRISFGKTGHAAIGVSHHYRDGRCQRILCALIKFLLL